MTNTKHTPGPWSPSLEAHKSTGGSMMALGDSDDYAILICNDEAREHANARLIAAAPDLLAALKEVTAMPSIREDRGAIWHDAALAAIAKAEGRAND